MIEIRRRHAWRECSQRNLFKQVIVIHFLMLTIELVGLFWLSRSYSLQYATRPVITTMFMNAILGGISDTVAQTISTIRSASIARLTLAEKDVAAPAAVEFHDLDKKGKKLIEVAIPIIVINNNNNNNNIINNHNSLLDGGGGTRSIPLLFDFRRLIRFIMFGIVMTPIQCRWYKFLSVTFPLDKNSGLLPILKMVAFDQFFYAPSGLACFFLFMTLTEGGGRRAATKKFQEMYIPALKANFILWPPVQIINFRIIPLRYQIPFVSAVGIVWNTFLSLSNTSDNNNND